LDESERRELIRMVDDWMAELKMEMNRIYFTDDEVAMMIFALGAASTIARQNDMPKLAEGMFELAKKISTERVKE
jgi:uncharacterized heparinase superfamily protein